MKNCLVCQSDADRVELLRIPVNLEGSPFGDLLLCRGCFDLLGSEEVKRLVFEAVREQSYDASQFIAASSGAEDEGEGEGEGDALPRQADFEVSESMLRDPAAFARALGESLAPLLLARYRSGKNQVNLITACAADPEGGFRFQALAEDA